MGAETTLTYDAYALFPTRVTDPVGLTTQASIDYRVLQPREMIDVNGNRSAVAFTPLGLVERTAVMGKVGENVGDTLEVPGSRLVYDFLAFVERGQPVSVRTVKRIHHVNEVDVPLPERDETIESIAYSDGFGRVLQTRTQAEDLTFGDPHFGDAGLPADQSQPVGDAVGRRRAATDPSRVVVSGWQIYDNKGRVVEKYEPFFSNGFAYAPPTDAQFGQKAVMFYDPRGQVIRTVNPDGSEQRVIFGAPENLTTPEAFTPTPWEAYTYDANDNAGRTHATAANGYQPHWNTPASIVVDALGRTVIATARNGTNSATDWITTRSTYNIQGNLLTVTDALGRVAFRYVYDLAKHPLRTESIDAGLRRAVIDALGNPIEERDSKGALALHAYDVLHRPLRMWTRDGNGQPLTLRERLVYGDAADSGLTPAQAAAANLLGKPYQHYDEAGLATVESYDFKGNGLEKTRQVISDGAQLKVFTPPPANWQVQPFRVDWQPPTGNTLPTHASALLDTTVYRTSLTYDALDRVKVMRYPQDVEGKRKELRPRYNRAGALEQVQLDGKSYVEHIAYNAKGQRTLIAYGNGVMTRHAYDPKTFRLVRLRTERYPTPATLTYRSTGTPLQDFAYRYDLVGNITAILERTLDSGVLNTPLGKDALDRAFTYDPLYRLLSATGRECDTPPSPPWLDQPRGVDLTRTRNYSEQYRYDPAGNLTRLQHQSANGEFVRELTVASANNRLANVAMGQTTFAYTYDANGNLVQENNVRHYEWDYADRMRGFRTQTSNAEPSVHAQYLYSSGGQRVKKAVRKQGGKLEVTVYINGIFEHQRIIQGSTVQQNNTLHVMDNQGRIALVRVGAPFFDDTTPAVKFHLGDHLGSSHLVLNDTGAVVNREEYTPYGETSFGSFAKKRYRFTGKERDEESGLSYHGARYYAPWLAKWASCDPAGMVDGANLYRYALGNPIRLTDLSGMQAGPAEQRCFVLNPHTGTQVEAIGRECDTTGTTPGNSTDSTVASTAENSTGSTEAPTVGQKVDLPVVSSAESGPVIGPDGVVRPNGKAYASEAHAADLKMRADAVTSNPLSTLFMLVSRIFGGDEQTESKAIQAGAPAWGVLSSIKGGLPTGKAGGKPPAGGGKPPVQSQPAGAPPRPTPLKPRILSPTIYRFQDRDVTVVDTSFGPQGFYRSTGDNSAMRDRWLPFNGYVPWMNWWSKEAFTTGNAKKGTPLYRFGNHEFQSISYALGEMNIPKGEELSSGMDVNRVLSTFGARVILGESER
ncbi:MAG: RHS repeat-associated core domain-containing protein [Deltaproteobacteria bacterium]|nr:RHS repeat-associated core domain-containing protein [Deltaproteobacteria bacterium]